MFLFELLVALVIALILSSILFGIGWGGITGKASGVVWWPGFSCDPGERRP
jgi:hypothetical protein